MRSGFEPGEVKGQVSGEQGRLSGAVPDYTALAVDEPLRPEEIPTTESELIYIGKKAWARTGGDWHRTSPGLASGVAPDPALYLLQYVPGGPPKTLLDDEFAEFYESYVFGVSSPHGMGTLTQGRLMGRESVNGVRALHYRGRALAGESGFLGGPLEDGRLPRTDIWLAEDGLYLVRVRASSPQVPGVSGITGDHRVDIYDANRRFTVRAPGE